MVSKQENNIDFMDAKEMKLFFDQLNIEHKELSKQQRKYKEILSKRYNTRADTIIEKGLWKAIESLRSERNKLRAQIWVADGAQHIHENSQFLKEIKCHVDCQEHLAKDIDNLKVSIQNMEREMGRVNKEIYELNREIVPESQHQAHVAKIRKKLGILENQLEVGIRRECSFWATNAQLREELDNILHDRSLFNDIYTKLVQNLNSDKKYMVDLMEYAENTFENCINVGEKIELTVKKYNKDEEARKSEIQSVMRTSAANQKIEEFVQTKAKVRLIAPLQPKETARRENFKRKHNRKIKLYNTEIGKLLEYTHGHTVYEIIERYQQQESLYYSYFSLDNERGFHITLLNNSVNRLFNEVERLKMANHKRIASQLNIISELEEKLEQKEQRNKVLENYLEKNNQQITKFLANMQTIFILCRTNDEPLQELLGDHTRLTLENLQRFTRLLEKRVIEVVANVYVKERANENISSINYTVHDIEKVLESQTKLNDIVLTQQCPECAEGEAFNTEETAEGGAAALTLKEAKKNLYEKVVQPEMQYRLHSISQCRLPRSRLLAAKRNI